MVNHPLDPLTPQEIHRATAFLKDTILPTRGVPFVKGQVLILNMTLARPPKSVTLTAEGQFKQFRPGDRFPRVVEVDILDAVNNRGFQCRLSITEGENPRETYWTEFPKIGQPLLHLDEFIMVEQLVKNYQPFRDAMAARGLNNPEWWMVEPWSAGNLGLPKEQGLRLMRTLIFTRMSDTDFGYAHPVDGLICIVDVCKRKVIELIDERDSHGNPTPVPLKRYHYTPDLPGGPTHDELRTDIKPIHITQPEGVSFTMNGNVLSWQKWSMHIDFNAREGLVMNTVGYEDKGRIRPIFYRASVTEMAVPYGSPSHIHSRKCAFDLGEYGIGYLSNSLKLGCDCLGVIKYLDGHVVHSDGTVRTIPQVVCIHEEDAGILWKHTDWRLELKGDPTAVQVRRSRRLVVSFFSTIGNYEYGFYWYFYQDGSIEFEAKASGIINIAGAMPQIKKSPYGQMIGQGLEAQVHQHMVSMRVDWNVDGVANTVYEVDAHPITNRDQNPYGNAMRSVAKKITHELADNVEGVIDQRVARYWKIVNHSSLNRMGEPVAWKIVPGHNSFPLILPDSWVSKRAQFHKRHVWVTAYNPDEKYAGGELANQSCGEDGIEVWIKQDRNLEDSDIVTWYSMIMYHSVRLEDWPVMPVERFNVAFKPLNFFDMNPALDVPPSCGKHDVSRLADSPANSESCCSKPSEKCCSGTCCSKGTCACPRCQKSSCVKAGAKL